MLIQIGLTLVLTDNYVVIYHVVTQLSEQLAFPFQILQPSLLLVFFARYSCQYPSLSRFSLLYLQIIGFTFLPEAENTGSVVRHS